MKTIGFHIQKGGVGKTTVSGSVAFYLASKGRKTVIIDGDPQGSASTWLVGKRPGVKYELADVLTGSAKAREALFPLSEHLSIIPSFGKGGGLKNYAEGPLLDEPFIFLDLREELEKAGFEFVVYDLSPGMSRLERCIILSFDEVITPFTPEFFSLDGLDIFRDELKKIQKSYRREVQHSKIVINALNQSFRRHTLITESFRAMPYQLFIIPQDSHLAEAQMVGKTIFESDPHSKSAQPIRDLAEAIAGD